ncbi:NAD(P)/FAD-dependent oxidoreductase [Paeniglutamicibacter cryotolerans]|uniref:3-phenylpropionate/trans-cinnamate dioxygenase ferredoxin reductase subunit n=1 Tax=Paeniglutamicibacter cryotolerans TaxID=670079 RepID=A0A839QRH9_9MICC|nr:FAD-dependent oxidoreductase [Paeniglutamicibacter cryotolerans]MBB2995862.1 3-phenylpropionate/trans-cinnamate dioxygenase ferredoxin reductase subunit [Paeniglutamicibacter cryotolerans]
MDSTAAHEPVVIIGGGQAGIQVADSLRAEGFAGSITIVNDEPGNPYQRPPLSKDYLAVDAPAEPLPLRGAEFFADKDIVLLQDTSAAAVDTVARRVTLSDGNTLAYGHLVFATGATNRALPCPGASLPGVHALRSLSDAEALQEALAEARNVVVIGAGFIGLEFAAGARARGLRVTVLEFAPRPMGRALSSTMSDWFTARHLADGIDLRLNEGVAAIHEDGAGLSVESTTGARYAADLVLYGVGVTPRTELAESAGLPLENGIVVDQSLRTSVEGVLAVGDCASFPNIHTGARTRLESVQNATDQGRHAARSILGASAPYTDTPWFWSTQGPIRLQIAGISAPGDHPVLLGDPSGGKFSIALLRAGVLAAVESVNAPADHISARKIVGLGLVVSPEALTAPGFNLKAFAKEALATPA